MEATGDLLLKLPTEIQVRVLSYFTPKELTRTVAKVCKGWWLLSQDPSLWKWDDLSLGYDDEENPELPVCKTMLSRISSLRRLHLYKIYSRNVMLLLSSWFPEKLKELELDRCEMDVEILGRIVKTGQCIELFKVDVAYVDINMIISMPKLQSVELFNCGGVDEAGIAVLCKKLSTFKICNHFYDAIHGGHGLLALQELEIGDFELTDKSMMFILYSVSFPIFRHTFFYKFPLTDKHLEETPKDLKCLGLKDSNDGKSISKVALKNLFTRTNLLEELIINQIHEFDDGILRAISVSSQELKKLSIIGCPQLTSKGVESVIINCWQLSTLNLQDMPQLTDGFLRHAPTYLKLTISNCAGQAPGLQEITD